MESGELLTSEQEDKTNILLDYERINSGRVESQDETFILLRRKEREEKLMNLNLYYWASSISRRVTIIFFVYESLPCERIVKPSFKKDQIKNK